MRIVVLYFDRYIGELLREVLELEGYAVVVRTDEAKEVLRALEEGSGPMLLLADSFLTNPAAREALARLAEEAELRRRVRVIGLSAWSGSAVENGLVDAFIPLPFTVSMLLETIEANVGRGSDE